MWNLDNWAERTTQYMCLRNMICISITLRTLYTVQGFEHTFWIQRRRLRLQAYQKHTGTTLHVGPNKGAHKINISLFFSVK